MDSAEREETTTGEAVGKAPGRLTREGQLGAAVTIAAALAIGVFLLVAPLIRAAVPITPLPAPLPDTHQDAETLLMIIAFALLFPAAAIVGPGVCDRIAAGPNAAALPALAGSLVATLALVPLAGRIGGVAVMCPVAGAWLVGASVALLRAAAAQPWRVLIRLAPWSGRAWAAAACLLGLALVAFSAIASVTWWVLAAGAMLAGAFLAIRERSRTPRTPRALGLIADGVVATLLFLAVPNLVIFAPDAAASGGAFDVNTIMQFHQDLFLGPTNEVLHGHAMLVDVLAQYGVGSIYFLAAVFGAIPIGNGTLGFTEGILSALMFTGVWASLRIAGVNRLLAAAAMAVAVVVLVLNLVYPLGGLLQHGAIRFGLPVGVIVGAVAEARWPRSAVPARLLQLLTLAVSSIWALEAFAYTTLTILAVAALHVWLQTPGARLREALIRLAEMAAAVVTAHALFAVITLVATGELPRWGWYLKTLREFLFGHVGDLTYDFSPWSPGLAVGAVYLVSAIALVIVLRKRRDLANGQRPLLVAIAACTAFGVALFTYLVNRSADHIIPYVSLPVAAIVALWMTLIERPAMRVAASVRRGAWALVLAISVFVVAVAASGVPTRFEQSALGITLPGGNSPRAALHRLWYPPPLHHQSAEGVSLLEQYMPRQESSSVFANVDLGIELLLRSRRGSAVPLGDPWEDSLVPDDHLEPLGKYVEGLHAGDRLLLDAPAQESFDLYRRDPSLDPLAAGQADAGVVPSGITPLQAWTLKRIGERWDLRTLAKTPDGLEVVELVPRPARRG